jgi:dihydroorotate dehydrogenase (NAD+) catalytic subunit
MKADLAFKPPLMNAAGSLGFAPVHHPGLDPQEVGAFVTHPISLGPRGPAHGVRYLPCAGGFLLHTGYPNPGLSAVLRRYAGQWERSTVPVLVHLLCQEPAEVSRMAARLESIPGVAGLELGLPPDVDATTALAMVEAAYGELPLIVRLPLERALELGRVLASAHTAAFSLGPPRGALPLEDGSLLRGRLYGPAIFSLALAAVQALKNEGITVIGAGGVYTPAQAQVMLHAGALAVQLDAVLWRGGWPGSK